MPDMTNRPDEKDDGRTGFNLETQKLHCLIVLNDEIASAMSERAGDAFFRAFVVEDRRTGEVFVKQRFRYKDGDSWYEMHLNEERRKLPLKERVQYLAGGIEAVMLKGVEVLGGVPISESLAKQAVICFYPPNPDDSEATLGWLFEKDLIQTTQVIIHTPEGEEVIPISDEGKA